MVNMFNMRVSPATGDPGDSKDNLEPGENPGQDKSHCHQEKDKNKIYLSRLVNSALYFIDFVLMIEVKGEYHLLVIHDGTVLWHRVYSTIRGARIAFQKVFKIKSFQENINADWSDFYDPEVNWLNKRLALINESAKSLL